MKIPRCSILYQLTSLNTLLKSLKYLWVLSLLISCSSQVGGPASAGYHNLTAHYNAYFIADEAIKQIETELYDKYDWNYNKVLPVFAQFDTTYSKTIESQTKDCIEKASIAIQRHLGSNWEDNSYLLVGKARFYSSEFPDAIETFKYVNKKSEDKDVRHAALIDLMRVFIESKEYNNAVAVSDYLKKEDINKENTFKLNLCKAYLFQNRKDENQFVQYLVMAEEMMPHSNDRSRIRFIIGQLYQKLEMDAESYQYYSKALKSNPSYELSFYTKLNMSQVTALTENDDVKKVRKYFKKLLKDPKNLEYKDKIYYEMAAFELKNGNTELAIDYYKASVKSSVKNDRQKAYSYLKLGLINYETIKNFSLAKSYYDSTIAVMPKDEEDYLAIKSRQEILSDFVEQYQIVFQGDSLLALANLSEDSVRNMARAQIEEQIADKKEKQKRAKEQAAAAQRAATSFDKEGGELISAGLKAGDIWYFYNSTLVSKGNAEFKRVWGNRPLEDNWRRSSKIGSTITTNQKITQLKTTDTKQEEETDVDKEIDALMAKIPWTEEAQNEIKVNIEKALYNLANIYHFKLLEEDNAIESFESHLTRYPTSEYKPEILYQLFIIYGQLKDKENAIAKANLLKSEYPESIYAKLVDNPRYREESQAATILLKKLYTQAYHLYKEEKYPKTKNLLDSILIVYPENPFSDNLKLLQIMTIGMTDGIFKYQFELNNFIKNYPESDLLDHAKFLLKTSEEYQVKVVNSTKARFIPYFDQKHLVVIAYPNKENLSQTLPSEVEKVLLDMKYNYSTANLILNDTYAIVLVNEVENKSKSLEILNQIKSIDFPSKYKGEKIYEFVITQDNFDIFYQTKDLNAYLNFYDRMYP
jgi:tetratricopeptide (TPR) repeat protein/outer membrane protein assembly factor BamD (BamD/ComL family)